MAFKNPVTVRGEPVQLVAPDGSFEAQCVCDIDDFPLVKMVIERLSGGGLFVRLQGDLIEIYALHDTRTAAEGTIKRWKAALAKELNL